MDSVGWEVSPSLWEGKSLEGGPFPVLLLSLAPLCSFHAPPFFRRKMKGLRASTAAPSREHLPITLSQIREFLRKEGAVRAGRRRTRGGEERGHRARLAGAWEQTGTGTYPWLGPEEDGELWGEASS